MESGVELLQKVAPPIELMETLEKSNMPQNIRKWWELWTVIRADGKSEIDSTNQDVYQQALIVVDEAVKKAKVY